MRQPSDPDGAKLGDAFDGTSVLIAGGALAERRKASPPSPANFRRNTELNQQQYNSLHGSAVSHLVQQRDHQQDSNPNKITEDLAPPQQPLYPKNNRAGKRYYLVDLDVTILGDDSLIEPHSSPTTTSSPTSDYASTTQPHRDSANVPQPKSPSSSSSCSSSSRNNTNTASSPQQPQPAHGLLFKDQARSVGTISAEAVVAMPDHGAYDRLGAARGLDTLGTNANVPADHHHHHAVIARRISPPPPNDPLRPPPQQHPATRPPPWNDSNPTPPPLSNRTPEETIFSYASFAVPKQQTGCGCVIQ